MALHKRNIHMYGIIAHLVPFLFLTTLIVVSSLYSYILFHITVEMFSVIIATAIFMFAWNTRKMNRNRSFLFLSIGYAVVGSIEFLHALTYKGINIFSGIDANVPTQLWIGGRYLLAVTLLLFPGFTKRNFNERVVIAGYTLIAILFLLSVFYWKNFPVCYREGTGLTTFKIYSEYIIAGMFVLAGIALTAVRERFDRNVFILLISSIILNIVSELLFTLYTGVYDQANMIGHMFMLGSYYLVYKAIIEVGLTKPFTLLFRDLSDADRKKDEFLHIVSHEVRNPLSAIKAFAQLTAKQLSKENVAAGIRNISRINEQVEKIEKLVRYLLDISTIEKGSVSYARNVFDIDTLITKTVSVMKKTAGTHTFMVKSKAGVRIHGDESWINQVLTNLLSNAVKYSPKGSPIFIRAKKVRSTVQVSVQDFGIGIPPEKQKHLFQKFYRAQEGKNKAEGTGLGLYISKEIILAHRGTIWVKSMPGKGTTFTFSLPIDR